MIKVARESNDPSCDGANTSMFGLNRISEMAIAKEDFLCRKRFVNSLLGLVDFG